jgi:hypothetical protein
MIKKKSRTKQRPTGYHIAHTIRKPPRLLNNRGEFTEGSDALVFITSSEAAEYMKERKLNLVGLYSIVLCECSDIQRMSHTYKSEGK